MAGCPARKLQEEFRPLQGPLASDTRRACLPVRSSLSFVLKTNNTTHLAVYHVKPFAPRSPRNDETRLAFCLNVPDFFEYRHP
jgi:hypothetical protein